MGKTITCEHCGKKFETHSWNGKYCSEKCRRDAYYLRYREALILKAKIRRIKGIKK